jgi:hypothetical protein
MLLLLLQELVNVMWAISCMDWSPPMLYWRGLLDAARSKFGRFNAQDLANCISAGDQYYIAAAAQTQQTLAHQVDGALLAWCMSHPHVCAANGNNNCSYAIHRVHCSFAQTLLLPVDPTSSSACRNCRCCLCIYAATAVDVSSIQRQWLAAFLQASEPKLASFSALQLAHTVSALAAIDKAHDWAASCIHAAWQEAFVQAAARQLGNKR